LLAANVMPPNVTPIGVPFVGASGYMDGASVAVVSKFVGKPPTLNWAPVTTPPDRVTPLGSGFVSAPIFFSASKIHS
jgi:hypothetical protein